MRPNRPSNILERGPRSAPRILPCLWTFGSVPDFFDGIAFSYFSTEAWRHSRVTFTRLRLSVAIAESMTPNPAAVRLLLRARRNHCDYFLPTVATSCCGRPSHALEPIVKSHLGSQRRSVQRTDEL